MAKSRGRRRKRYTPEAPLKLQGNVHLEELGPDRDGWWLRLFEAVVELIPAFDGSSEGRFKSAVIKIGLGAVAISLVTARDDHWSVALFGVVIAMLILIIPLGDTQKVRILARIKRSREPKATIQQRHGDLFFDGSKLSLKTGGRTLHSIRPFGDEPAKVGLFQSGANAYFSLVRGKGKKRKELWVRSSIPEWEEWTKKGEPGRIPSLVGVLDLSVKDFVTLVEAFTGR